MPEPTEPVVVTLMIPFPVDDTIRDAFRVSDAVEVHSTPYFESSDVRSSKGRNNGVDPDGHPTPDITDAMRDIWARTEIAVSMDLPADAPSLFPRLRWFQGMGAGYDHIDVDTLAAMGVVQTNASGIASVPMAEFVIGRLLQEWKSLRALDAQQRDHTWEPIYGNQVAGRTIGIVGLGSIGREVARRARAFGMTVRATRGSARPDDTDPDADVLLPADQLGEMIGPCDAVVIAAPATPATEDLFDAEMLSRMAQGSILVNVGRGTHVVEADLIAALESGHLRAAVLDVTRQEPLPVDDPLWDAPNLYLSPHSSVSLDRYQQNVVALAVDNLRRYLAGEELRNVVSR